MNNILTNNKYITWLSRLALYAGAIFLLYVIFGTLWQFRSHIPTVDEGFTYIFVENVLHFGRFRTGILPISVNYNPGAPVYIYLAYALEMILRMPFHILSYLFGDTRITKLAPVFYLILLLIIFVPRIQKKGKEEYALLVGISMAVLATMQTVANAFFRIRYFAFLYISVFLCVILFAHLYSKPLSSKRIALMICVSVIPILFHPYAFFVTFPMLLLICIKFVKEKKLNFRGIWDMYSATTLLYKICIIVGILGLMFFAVSIILPIVISTLRGSVWFSLNTLDSHIRMFTGPRIVHTIGFTLIVHFIFLQRKKLSDFLRILFYLCFGSLVFSSFIAFITGDWRLGYDRYNILGITLMSIIVAISIILLFQNIFSFKKETEKRGISGIFHKGSIKVMSSLIAVIMIVLLSVSSSGYKGGNHDLPIIFPEHYASLTYGIERLNISPENLYIISNNDYFLVNYYLDTRVFISGIPPELSLGERTDVWVLRPPAFFRDYSGWTYDLHSRPLLGTIEDWHRLLLEIDEAEADSSYVALGLLWLPERQRFCDELNNLFATIEMPTDYTPLPLSDIINRMYANDFYVPEHLIFFVDSR